MAAEIIGMGGIRQKGYKRKQINALKIRRLRSLAGPGLLRASARYAANAEGRL